MVLNLSGCALTVFCLPSVNQNTFLVSFVCIVPITWFSISLGNSTGWKVDPLLSFYMGPGQLTIQSIHTTKMKKRDLSFFQPPISSWGHVRSNPGQSINLAKTNESFQVLSILKSDNLRKSLGSKESRLVDSNYFSDLSVQRNPVQLFKEETRVSITRLEQFSGFEFFQFFG